MKIVLSRKGFDSSAGGRPNPILPCGELCPLPIPDEPDSASPCYDEISAGGLSLGKLVSDLTDGRIAPEARAHLDPDLRYNSMPRPEGWRPVFGQSEAAESHLQKKGVGAGDIFLFFGWFREVEQVAGRYRYVKGASNLHVMFGWLQIERRIPVEDRAAIPTWAGYHPHCNRKPKRPDVIYTSKERLELPSVNIDAPGGGTFTRFDDALCLTMPGSERSVWQLPGWFYPEGKASALSYHGNTGRWSPGEDHVLLKSVGRGQEFVLYCHDYPEVLQWLGEIFSRSNTAHR